jgi:transposase
MTKSFRPWKVDEVWLLPPSVREFVPAGHPAHLVRDIVAEELDLSAILSAYTESRGYPPYHPAMMVALLLYAYSRGVYSSRRVARACEERLDFQAVTALNQPDFRTISEFRRRHLVVLAELFVQVLALCRCAGLVGLDHVAVDGTKLRANASQHKAMSYARMGSAEAELAAEVDGWLAQAEGADAEEDAALGAARRGDEMPGWMRDKQRRLERIRAAKAELEAEAQAAEAAKPDPGCKADGSPRQRRGRKPKPPPGVPKPTAQRNFTDPESRIMKGRDGFVQASNAQAAVDAKAQVILAHHLTNNAADQDALGPLLEAVTANTEARPPRFRPIAATAPRPTWLTSPTAGFAATSLPAAPSTLMAAKCNAEAHWSRPCASGSDVPAGAAATDYASRSSSPSSGRSRGHEAFGSSFSAASKR